MTQYVCRTCGKEGEKHFYAAAKYYCKGCWNKKTREKQKDNVGLIKKEYGGKCSCCGYNNTLAALEFHHRDPSTKEFHFGSRRGLSLDKLRKELDKCILVCRNCHAEIHAGLRII